MHIVIDVPEVDDVDTLAEWGVKHDFKFAPNNDAKYTIVMATKVDLSAIYEEHRIMTKQLKKIQKMLDENNF